MKIRFQADNDLRRQIVVAIRRHYLEIEILSAQEAELDEPAKLDGSRHK